MAIFDNINGLLQKKVSKLNSDLEKIGTVYRASLSTAENVVDIAKGQSFCDLTLPAGTYLVSMSIRNYGNAQAFAWLRKNGVVATEGAEYMLVISDNNAICSQSKAFVLEKETTLSMSNASGTAFQINHAELNAVRLK